MKVYISAASVREEEAMKLRFEKAEHYLLTTGHTITNRWKKYFSKNISGSNRYLYDMKVLAASDVLFLLHDWQDSQNAIMEKAFAESSDKKIWFENNWEEEELDVNLLIVRVAEVIEEVTQLRITDYRKESRIRKFFYARMLFSFHCYRLSLLPEQIGEFIYRDHTTVRHYLRKYENEYRFNASFRKVADRVTRRLRRRGY